MFADTCSELEGVLAGSTRETIVRAAAQESSLGVALLTLREGMRSHVWKVGDHPFTLERAIQKYDRKTRQLGFHVLHDWDGIADRVNADIIPVDVLHYLVEKRGGEPAVPAPLAVLLDYYFMHVLALLSLRIWDEGDADANLDRVGNLLRLLQGAQGSGQHFAADAETLLLIGTSHYELHERGYAALLERTRTLSRMHQLRIALGHAASIGSHLRFGFTATYGRDTVNMRDDNVADYPWLCFALATLMKEYSRSREADAPPAAADQVSEEQVVEAMLNGLCADARAFVGAPPASLAAWEAERAGFREAFHAYRRDLLRAFEPHRPSEATYSPLGFCFNFSHNVVKGAVVDALLRAQPWAVTLNDLLTALPRDAPQAAAKLELATTLMGYARDNPHRIRGRLRPVIVYDVQSGRQAFSVTIRKLTGES